MSNKSRLQTNNTNLQSLINKANALPDAGGSGGGSVEAWTGSILIAFGYSFDGYYTDENLTAQVMNIADLNEPTPITITKNTYINLYQSGLGGGGEFYIEGNNIEIISDYSDKLCVLPTANNFTINIISNW